MPPWLQQEIAFGLNPLHIGGIFLVLAVVSRLLSRRSSAISDKYKTAMRCPTCGWSGTVSKQFQTCPKCGNRGLG